MPFWVGPRVLDPPHAITADAEIPKEEAGGVLSRGSAVGGWSFYVKDGRLRYAHNYVGRATYQVSAPPTQCPLAGTSCALSSSPQVTPTSPGQGLPRRAQLSLDGQLLRPRTSSGHHAHRLQPRRARLQPRLTDYQAPFRFTGTLHTVTSGDLITDTDMRMAMARQ